MKAHTREKWTWPWARGAPQTLEFSFNISATTEDSDFKIGRQVGFAKAHHKTPPGRKSGRGHGLKELPKMLGFHFNFFATAEGSAFKIGRQVRFAKAHHKIPPRKKERGPVLRELPKFWGFPFKIYAMAESIDFNLVHSLCGQLGSS